MSATPTASTSTQSLSSLVLQQLMANSGSSSSSGLTPALLQAVLKQAGSGTATSTATSTASQTPAAVTQALGDLLSGGSGTTAQADLGTLQRYFKEHPQQLTSVLSDLQGAGTYAADGTVGTSSQTLLAALTGSSGTSSTSSALLAALASGSGGAASPALLTALLGTQSTDPLLASLGGGSSSTGSISLLG